MKTREISLLLNWERRWGTKSDCAVKRMCRDEKNHELVWQKTHREAKAVVLGRRKISPLFLHSWTHCLLTLRWTNYVVFLISKKQVFKVRGSKRLASSLHRVGGQWKKGLSQTLWGCCHFWGGTALPKWLKSTNIFQCKGTAEDPSLHLWFYDMRWHAPSLPFMGKRGWKVGQVLHSTCIYIICALQKITA